MASPEALQTPNAQSMLDGFVPVPGIDVPHEPTVAPQPVASGTQEGYAFDYDRPYDELGGGVREDAMIDPPRFVRPPRKPRRIGNVRDVEPRDSDLDPEWTTSVDISPSQKAANVAVIAAIREQRAPQVRAQLVEEYGESQTNAILRARAERRQRTK